MNYLGIDYGEKRIGLSYGDDVGVAVPLPAAVEKTFADRLKHIRQVITERKISELVIGYPYNMDDSIGFKAKEVDRFVEVLEQKFKLPVHRVDERLSSYSAEESMKAMGRVDERKKGTLDSRAATLILQDFLDTRYPPVLPLSGEYEDDYDDQR